MKKALVEKCGAAMIEHISEASKDSTPAASGSGKPTTSTSSSSEPQKTTMFMLMEPVNTVFGAAGDLQQLAGAFGTYREMARDSVGLPEYKSVRDDIDRLELLIQNCHKNGKSADKAKRDPKKLQVVHTNLTSQNKVLQSNVKLLIDQYACCDRKCNDDIRVSSTECSPRRSNIDGTCASGGERGADDVA